MIGCSDPERQMLPTRTLEKLVCCNKRCSIQKMEFARQLTGSYDTHHLQVFHEMQNSNAEPDVVLCCSLITALESGGQWQLGLDLFIQMSIGMKKDGTFGCLFHTGHKLLKVKQNSQMSKKRTQYCYTNALRGAVGFRERFFLLKLEAVLNQQICRYLKNNWGGLPWSPAAQRSWHTVLL